MAAADIHAVADRTAGIPVASGIGRRAHRHGTLLDTSPRIGWPEVRSENYLSEAAMPVLEEV